MVKSFDVPTLKPGPAEPEYALLLHSVDPDQLASEEALIWICTVLALSILICIYNLDQVIQLAEN